MDSSLKVYEYGSQEIRLSVRKFNPKNTRTYSDVIVSGSKANNCLPIPSLFWDARHRRLGTDDSGKRIGTIFKGQTA